MSKKEFFDDYYVDWGYGDTNHGATIKCLTNGSNFYHMGPFFGNIIIILIHQTPMFSLVKSLLLI